MGKKEQRREENPPKGLCGECDAPLSARSSVRCDRHLKACSAITAKFVSRRKAEGKCQQCGQPLAAKSKVYCSAHLNLCREQTEIRNKERNKHGLCRCNNETLVTGTLGRICILKRAAYKHLGLVGRWSVLESLLIQQGDRCFHCNGEICLGKNAAVGHKVSIARTGKTREEIAKSTKIDDLQWICEMCNTIQGLMTDQEYLAHCRLISQLNAGQDLSSDFYASHCSKVNAYQEARKK